MYDVRLEVNGVGYGGFRSGEFTLSLEQMCNSFALKYSDVWIAQGARQPIQEGNRCKLIVDGNVMVDGWVDEASASYTPLTYALSVNGRSTACDLVDCSAVHEPGQWRGQLASTIVADLVYPFAAVQVVTLGDQGGTIPRFTLQRGETVGNAITRLARLRSLLVYTAGSTLVLAKVGTTRTTTVLRRGVQIIEGARKGSLADRFSDYIFKGQTRATDTTNGVSANQIQGNVEDHGVPRYRPTMIVAGGADGPSDLGARAIMERNQRAGRAERLTLKVEGWKVDEGYLWEPNILVRVTDDWLDVDQDMIVVSASFTFNGDTGVGGYMTTLELCDPRAFDTGDAPLLRRRRRVIPWVTTDASISPLAVPSLYQWDQADVRTPSSNPLYFPTAPRAAPQPSARSTGRRRRS